MIRTPVGQNWVQILHCRQTIAFPRSLSICIAPGMGQASTHSSLHLFISQISRSTTTPPDFCGRAINAPGTGQLGTQGGEVHPRQTITANDPSYPPIVRIRTEDLSTLNTLSLILAHAKTH